MLMATKVVFSRVDTAANFTAANPVLALGESGWEQDTARIKVGDGVTAWNSLPYRFEAVPKIYFQASQTTANTGIGADQDLNLVENQNSDGAVFVFAANVLTINKTATFKFTFNVTGDTASGARETLRARLQRGGADIPLIEGQSQGYSYHRNNNSGEDTISISVILSVTSGQQFKVVVDSPTTGVDTIPIGTGLVVEEK